MSYDRNKYPFRIIIGGRGAGKTFSSSKLIANLYEKVKDLPERSDNVDDMFIWFRLERNEVTNVKAKGDLLDSKVIRDRKLTITFDGDYIFINSRKMGVIKPLSEASKLKGTDWEWSRYRFVILDEFQRERRVRNTFDVVYNLRSALESMCRFSTRTFLGYDYPTVIMSGNTIDEATDVLYAFDFLPLKYGTYKLAKKQAIIQYVAATEDYKNMLRNNPLRVLASEDDLTFDDTSARKHYNVLEPNRAGHLNYITHLKLNDYIVVQVWQTQQGHIYVAKDLPTKKFHNRHLVLNRKYANKGTYYNVNFHKMMRESLANNNIYFDKQITALIFDKHAF